MTASELFGNSVQILGGSIGSYLDNDLVGETDETFSVVTNGGLMNTQFIRAVSLCNGGLPVFYAQCIGAAGSRNIDRGIGGERQRMPELSVDGNSDGISGCTVKKLIPQRDQESDHQEKDQEQDVIFDRFMFFHNGSPHIQFIIYDDTPPS